MIIDNTSKSFFIHVPKNGGTSFRKFIINNTPHKVYNFWGVKYGIDMAHVKKTDYHILKKLKFAQEAGYKSIAITRDPYARFISAYKMYRYRLQYIDCNIFNFIKDLENTDKYKKIEFVHLSSQESFIFNNTRIIKIENINKNINYIKRYFNIHNIVYDLQHLNKSMNSSNLEDKRIIDYVNKTYERDFYLYGYMFK